MLRHADIWRAIDTLAREHGLTASGLARRAGLDPTTFNKSKRITREGKLRWPSTESISKILDATSSTIAEFVSYIGETPGAGPVQRIPIIRYDQAGERHYFNDTGHPTGGDWDEVTFPDLGDPHAYALEIGGEGMEPVYHDGDIIIVSPAASMRRGDRVVVKTADGEVMAKQLMRRSARRVELASIRTGEPERILGTDEVRWMHRIVWASQ